VPTTVGRSRGRQGVHSGAQGATGDHKRKIMATLITAIVVLVAVLVLTKAGREIDAATQRFMLYYAGVLALVGLTGSVLLGLLATDRIVMTPGHRVMAQAVHRAFSFGTLAFLVIHIVTEILAQRSHVIDAVIPFLSPYRTFYIGLGTIASDLIVLLVVTSIVRKRFTEHGKAWRWRAIHYASYVAFVFGVLHGLLGGRSAKPYVDWSYGFAIAVTALGLAVRFLAISLRPKESLPSSPSADRARAAGSSLHAAAMGLAQAQLGGGIGGTVQVLPAGLGGQGAADSWAALPTPGWSSAPRPLPALGPAPPHAGSPADDYRDLGLMPLGAPPYGDDGSAGLRARPYVSADQARSAPSRPARQPLYEPGYDGPPRFEGAPRGHGDIPQDELSSYPYGPRDRRPASPYAGDYPDRQGSGPRGVRPGMTEPARPRAALPAPPRPGDRNSGPIPQLRTGSMTQPGPGPMPRSDTGPLPRAGQGPPPRNGMGPGTGPMPRAGTGPMPRADSGPMPRLGTGPMPRPDTGPLPRAGQGPPRNGMGPGTGPMPRMGTGPMPRLGTGPTPRFAGRPDAGPMPRPDTGGIPSRPGTGPMPPSGAGPMMPAGSGPMPRPGTGPIPRPGPMPRPDQPLPAGDPATGPRTGPPPRTARRGSHRAKPTDPRYREMPGPTGGDEWR
jgi:DMSO/TMAO reductase YedYZ heme-binding membrane subunit